MSERRFAAIDIGTNTILLLIVELADNGTFRVLEDHAEITRLGAGVDSTSRIGAMGEERSLKALKQYLARCRRLGVDEIVAVGTSTLRDAQNSGEFKERLRRELGLELRVLSGEEEAAYAYLAVRKGLSLQGNNHLVVDVGGGSTELIWGKGSEVYRMTSLDLGSVRHTERFLLSDPVGDGEMDQLAYVIDRELEKLAALWRIEDAVFTVVGIAGTFTTLAAVEKGLLRYSHSEVHGSLLSRSEVQRQVELFKSKTVAERKKIPGLEPKRADVILAGALIIDRVMALFRIEEVTVSDQGIRYGVVYARLDDSRQNAI